MWILTSLDGKMARFAIFEPEADNVLLLPDTGQDICPGSALAPRIWLRGIMQFHPYCAWSKSFFSGSLQPGHLKPNPFDYLGIYTFAL